MKLYKMPRQFALGMLTFGASLILGLLSFGGMYAIWPVLPVAMAALGLSVAYEGEIYLQNIRGAMNKLFKNHYLQRHLAKAYLLEHFPNINDEETPAFFKDYQKQLLLLHALSDKHLDKAGKRQKKQVKKTLADMEKWFAKVLFEPASPQQTDYAKSLHQWLQGHDLNRWHAKLHQRQRLFTGVKLFSMLSAAFMGLGTTYLLMEAFSTIPMLAAIPFASWPLLIVPMAAIAGAAYGFLTFNAITDMINNNTLQNWYQKIKRNMSQGMNVRNAFMTLSALTLVCLAFALTICTAGTWWTVVKETKPLFQWMGKMPSFIMGVLNPLITSISAIVFNLQNSSESLEMIEDVVNAKKNPFSNWMNHIKAGWTRLKGNENIWQMLNPIRLVLNIVMMPLRIILFLGHLISIGVTSDRVPGISEKITTAIGIGAEALEDGHYFFHVDHHHSGESVAHLLQERLSSEHSHSHDLDLPTRFIKLCAKPFDLLACTWDWMFSQLNHNTPKPVLSFKDAWRKQIGQQRTEKHPGIAISAEAKPSLAWHVQQTLYRLDNHQEKLLSHVYFSAQTARKQRDEMNAFKHKVINSAGDGEKAFATLLNNAVNECPTSRHHRFFDNGMTKTQQTLANLPERIILNGSLSA